MALILRRRSSAKISPGEFHCAPFVTRSDLAFSSLEEIEKRSQTLLEKKKMAGFLDKVKDSQEVVNLVEQLQNAIMYYQVSRNPAGQTEVNAMGQISQQQSIYNQIGKLTVRLLIYGFDPRTDKIPADYTSLPLTRS